MEKFEIQSFWIGHTGKTISNKPVSGPKLLVQFLQRIQRELFLDAAKLI